MFSLVVLQKVLASINQKFPVTSTTMHIYPFRTKAGVYWKFLLIGIVYVGYTERYAYTCPTPILQSCPIAEVTFKTVVITDRLVYYVSPYPYIATWIVWQKYDRNIMLSHPSATGVELT